MKKLLKKNYIIISFIIFVILMLILLGFYPGLLSYDSDNQWQQVQSGIITDAHPFFSTFFMLILSKIWNNVTVVVIYQIILISVTWGYLCKVLKVENKNQIILMYIFSIMVFLTPLICLFSITVWKDIIYTSYLFLCAIMLFDWINSNYKFNTIKYCLLGLLFSLTFSYRHNGIIVAILLIILFYVIAFKKYKKRIINKQNLKKSFYVFISFFCIILFISIPKKIILENSQKKVNNQEISYSTIDNYMLWMMGAHIKENNIKNISDITFLNKIIPIDEWKETYNPYLINDTVSTKKLDKEYLITHEKKFRDIFIKYSLKNPMTIFKHYLKSDALLINPFASFDGYVYVYCYPISWYLPKYTMIRSKIPIIEKIYSRLINYSYKKIFIMFYQPAFILYVSIILAIILSKKVYGKKIWLFIVPMLCNTFSLLPINLAQDLRYVYINYLTFFGLLLMLTINFKKLKKKR